jgi:hypothetical protein
MTIVVTGAFCKKLDRYFFLLFFGFKEKESGGEMNRRTWRRRMKRS